MKRSQLRYLAYLIFKRGGVSGAIRRIVYNWKGVFSSSMILGALMRKYPVLIPADTQLFDCLQSMERQNKIERILENDCGIFYKCAPLQLWFKFT